MSSANPRGKPVSVGTNGTVVVESQSIYGFLCIASGTLTLTPFNSPALITALPVTAGQFIEIPFYIGASGYTVTLADGASGVLST